MVTTSQLRQSSRDAAQPARVPAALRSEPRLCALPGGHKRNRRNNR